MEVAEQRELYLRRTMNLTNEFARSSLRCGAAGAFPPLWGHQLELLEIV